MYIYIYTYIVPINCTMICTVRVQSITALYLYSRIPSNLPIMAGVASSAETCGWRAFGLVLKRDGGLMSLLNVHSPSNGHMISEVLTLCSASEHASSRPGNLMVSLPGGGHSVVGGSPLCLCHSFREEILVLPEIRCCIMLHLHAVTQ